MSKLRVAVLASGRGSNLQSLIDFSKQDDCNYEINLVISNKQDAYALQRATDSNIKNIYINPKNSSSNYEYEEEIHKNLEDHNIDFICLAGYMKLLGAKFINKWPNKIINIHPSLLPDFKGLNAQQQAFDAGVKIAGCTVHFVNDKMDDGIIIMQAKVSVKDDDNAQTLANNILAQEHILYPKVLNLIAKNKVMISGNMVEILQ